MSASDDVIVFKDEILSSQESKTTKSLKIITVDDDVNFQRSIAFALSNIAVLGRKIELLQAFSFSEASQMLLENEDIMIAFFDVVMETDDAGLRLVKSVREVLGNAELRIVLVTGQPGTAPMHMVMYDYDINDYWTKSELTSDRLYTILTTNLRSGEQIRDLARAKRGLQLIAESSGALYSSRSVKMLSIKMLDELAKLLGIPSGGIVCVKSSLSNHENKPEVVIVGASGAYRSSIGKKLTELNCAGVSTQLQQSLKNRESFYEAHHTCLFFPDEMAGANYAVYLPTGRPLVPTETDLLRVFSTNICGGLFNVSLVSRLDKLAFEDELLQIPNRNSLLRALDDIICNENSGDFTLILLDIDGFSRINTVLGTVQGDAVLSDVASTLRAAFDKAVLVCRVKDDKFAVVGPKAVVKTEIIVGLFKSARVQQGVKIVVNLSSVTFSLGFASESALDVLTRAGMTLKSAKQRGIKQHVVYDPTQNINEEHQFQLLQSLQVAINQKNIRIALQPQISVSDGSLTGIEVLARWTLPDGIIVSPVEFIPLAEATGLIMPLGDQVVEQACMVARVMKESGFGHLKVGVNLSVAQFAQEKMLDRILGHVHNANVSPEQIEFEVTETAAMQNFETVNSILCELRALKFSVAIDDFGTGFSSLSYLSSLPADRLKIDKSFVDRVTLDDGASAIVQTILHLGKSFNMNVIAEGVETRAQLDWLRVHGCADAQGYLVARPMSLSEFIPWLSDYEPFL